jgi:DNA processing protein
MKEQDLFYLLALQRIEGVGDIMAKLHALWFTSGSTKASALAAIDGMCAAEKI